jgi:hypothetical protein
LLLDDVGEMSRHDLALALALKIHRVDAEAKEKQRQRQRRRHSCQGYIYARAEVMCAKE